MFAFDPSAESAPTRRTTGTAIGSMSKWRFSQGRFLETIGRTSELTSLLEGLVGLSNNLSGEAGLRSMDHWISLQLVGDGKGLFRVTGDVRDQPGTGNRLTFEFEIDQTEIAPIVRDLEAILSEFPVKGSPDS